jgi:hypothetical protein
VLHAGPLQEFELPGIGSIGGFSGDRKSSEFFFSFTSEQAAKAASTVLCPLSF